jgi:hypothetical protein
VQGNKRLSRRGTKIWSRWEKYNKSVTRRYKIFWAVIVQSLVFCLPSSCLNTAPWRRRQHVPSKRRYLPTNYTAYNSEDHNLNLFLELPFCLDTKWCSTMSHKVDTVYKSYYVNNAYVYSRQGGACHLQQRRMEAVNCWRLSAARVHTLRKRHCLRPM